MKEIILTQGKVALVDDDDFEWINQWKWYANKNCNTYYAVRSVRLERKISRICMHRLIMKTPIGYEVDHKDGNGLNNQKNNLANGTHRKNMQNRHEKKTSKYPGVYWRKTDRKWEAEIKVNGKRKHLGHYNDEYEAFLVYKNAVWVFTGEDVLCSEAGIIPLESAKF